MRFWFDKKKVGLVVICLVWMRSLAARIGVGVRSMPTGSFERGGLMLQNPKPPVNPYENITDDPSRCINEDE